jgi:hypothetical protein
MNIDTVLMLEEIAQWHDPSDAAARKRARAKESSRRRRRVQYIDRVIELDPPLTEAERARLVSVLIEPNRGSP